MYLQFQKSSLSDRRIINDLELSTCICISTNNTDTFYSNQNMSILVQSSSNCLSLASTSLVPRGVTTTSISSDLTSVLSKLTNTSKWKVPTSNLPTLALHAWELSRNQLEIKSFCKMLPWILKKTGSRQSLLYICYGN